MLGRHIPQAVAARPGKAEEIFPGAHSCSDRRREPWLAGAGIEALYPFPNVDSCYIKVQCPIESVIHFSMRRVALRYPQIRLVARALEDPASQCAQLAHVLNIKRPH